MLVHRRVTPSKFTGTHLYTWVERGTVRVKCLPQEHNTMSPARARTRTARSGGERANHEATAPPTRSTILIILQTWYHLMTLMVWKQEPIPLVRACGCYMVAEVPVGIWIQYKLKLKIDRSVKTPWQEYCVDAGSWWWAPGLRHLYLCLSFLKH